MDILVLYKCFMECGKVIIDSCNCFEGFMFIVLKGEIFNGNVYVFQVLEKGCQYVVVDEKEYVVDGYLCILLVDDCLKVLQELVNYYWYKMGI